MAKTYLRQFTAMLAGQNEAPDFSEALKKSLIDTRTSMGSDGTILDIEGVDVVERVEDRPGQHGYHYSGSYIYGFRRNGAFYLDLVDEESRTERKANEEGEIVFWVNDSTGKVDSVYESMAGQTYGVPAQVGLGSKIRFWVGIGILAFLGFSLMGGQWYGRIVKLSKLSNETHSRIWERAIGDCVDAKMKGYLEKNGFTDDYLNERNQANYNCTIEESGVFYLTNPQKVIDRCVWNYLRLPKPEGMKEAERYKLAPQECKDVLDRMAGLSSGEDQGVVEESAAVISMKQGQCVSDSILRIHRQDQGPLEKNGVDCYLKSMGIDSLGSATESLKVVLGVDWDAKSPVEGLRSDSGRRIELELVDPVDTKISVGLVYSTTDFAIGTEYQVFASESDYANRLSPTDCQKIEAGSVLGVERYIWQPNYDIGLERVVVFPFKDHSVVLVARIGTATASDYKQVAEQVKAGRYPEKDKLALELLDQLVSGIRFGSVQ